MDLRVLVGVFVTLFGIAVGMAGGDIQSNELRTMLNEMDTSGGMTIPDLSRLTQFFSTTTDKPANTSIQAVLDASDGVTLETRSASDVVLSVPSDARIKVGQGLLTPASSSGTTEVTLHGFTGTTKVTHNVSISGRTNGITLPNMALNYTNPKQVAVVRGPVSNVTLHNLKGQGIAFQRANGTISSGSTDITLSGERASFNYFDGAANIAETSDAYRYRLNGKVHSATLRDGDSAITIGSN